MIQFFVSVYEIIRIYFSFSLSNMTTSAMLTTTMKMEPPIEVETVKPTSQYDYETATFELILPIIFGVFVCLTLG